MLIRLIIITLVATIVLYVAYTCVHSLLLLRKSKTLFAISSTFATQYSVGDSTKSHLQMIVLGDSTAAGSGVLRLEDSFIYKIASVLAQKQDATLQVTNYAYSGAQINDVFLGQAPKLKQAHPDIIIVSVGANDATHFTQPKAYRSTLRALITKLQPLHSNLYIVTTPDIHTVPAFPRWFSYEIGQRAEQQNNILQEVAQGTSVQVVDIYHNGKLNYQQHPEYYAVDLFHPSEEGYKVWTEVFIRSFEQKEQ